MPYATYHDVVVVDKTFATQADATAMNSGTIYYAEREIESRLSSKFAVPFTTGSAHPTIRDLTVIESLRRLTLGTDKSATYRDELDRQIDRLLSGESGLVTASGTAIFADSVSGASFWALDQSHKSVFDMRDTDQQRVDPDLLDELDNDDA